MATINTILGSDTITSSRTVINQNFTNLNTDKIETSVLDTDTALTNNSDTRVATQKAVKAYVDTGGNVNATTTSRGIVEVATQAEVDAGTALGATGASLMVTPATLAGRPVTLAAFQQSLGLSENVTVIGAQYAFTSEADGSAIYYYQGGAERLFRLERDTLTGQYVETHRVAVSTAIPVGDFGSLVIIGSHIYIFTNDGTNITARRFNKADLTTGTNMTVPTVACTSWCKAWTNNTDLYIVSSTTTTTSRRWTLSGTTFTAASTVAITAPTAVIGGGSFWDGTNAYLGGVPSAGSLALTIRKLTTIDGTTSTDTTKILPRITTASQDNGGIFACDATRMYMGLVHDVDDAVGSIANNLVLLPITKP